MKEPVTFGDMLRNRRLELRLRQKEVALLLGVGITSIGDWENNHKTPNLHHYPRIIDFLGYFPFDVDTFTLGGKITYYRFMKGLTKAELARELGTTIQTVREYERDKYPPTIPSLKKFDAVLVEVEKMKKKYRPLQPV